MPESRPRRRPRPCASIPGEIRIGCRQVAILNGLLDRPDGTARSSRDLHDAAWPYLSLFGSTVGSWELSTTAWRMSRDLVRTWKVGNRRLWRITDRGRAIAAGELPTRIPGYGRYHGIRELRSRHALGSRAARIEAEWNAAIKRSGFQPLAREVTTLFQAWTSSRPRVVGMMEAMKQQWLHKQVWTFLCQYALRYGVTPTGKYDLAPGRRRRDLRIDFRAVRVGL